MDATTLDTAFASLGMEKIGGVLGGIFKQMEWAEEEIAAAQKRHPDLPHEQLWDTFMLHRATCDNMAAEFIYRAHVRELMERVAAGEDTRPPTDVELACALSEESLRHPLGTGATTLYMRVFARAFPDKAATLGDLGSHENVGGQQADGFERELRRKLRQDWRRR